MSTPKFQYPLRVQAEFDDEPVYIVDAADEEVLCLQRSADPSKDVELAHKWARDIECQITGSMQLGDGA